MIKPVYDQALAHRSIRKYRPDPVPFTIIEKMLEAGLNSSTSGNMQTWSAIVTTDQVLRRELYKLHLEQDMILEAPCVVTYCADFSRMRRWTALRDAAPSFDDLMGFMVAALDAMIAAQTSVLVAEQEGLGICYMGTTLYSPLEIAKLLGCPKYVLPVTSIVLGYPNETPDRRKRLSLSHFIHREKYASPEDHQILSMHEEKETEGWKRLMSMPHVAEEIERLKIANLASYYTSEAKYSKTWFSDSSTKIVAALKQQGFWEF